MTGKELKIPQLQLIGYRFVSLINSMGIVYWLLIISIVFLIPNLILYICKAQAKKLTRKSQYLKYIKILKNISESLYNYLVVNQIISIVSLTLYLW